MTYEPIQWRITCDDCDEPYHVDPEYGNIPLHLPHPPATNQARDALARIMQTDHWSIRGDRHLCPPCTARADTATAEALWLASTHDTLPDTTA